jgi:hypothetical protein
MANNNISQHKQAKPILGGHETFAFRNGWLKKGVDAANLNGTIFTKMMLWLISG